MDGRTLVDKWGESTFADFDQNIHCRRGEIYGAGGADKLPVSIMISPNGIKTFNRSKAGIPKARLINEASGDFIYVRKQDFEEFERKGYKVAFAQALFGARAFDVNRHIRRVLGRVYDCKIIKLKTQRVDDPNSPTSWGIKDHGWDPTDTQDIIWQPMSDTKKEDYIKNTLIERSKYIEQKGIDHLVCDILIIKEGAAASGETLEYLLRTYFEMLTQAGKDLPKKVMVYVNFGSTQAVFKAANVCRKYGVELDFTFMGSAIEVSIEGLVPGLKYTDLSHMRKSSITWKSLYNHCRLYCIGVDGNEIDILCSCGDVGDSLDNPPHYYVDTLLEFLVARVDLSLYPILTDLWYDLKGITLLKKRIHDIQIKNHLEIRNCKDQSVQEIVWEHEEMLLCAA